MTSILLRIADDEAVSLDPAERELLRRAAPHALRHTFATGAVARGLREDVLQRLLGHLSRQTTSIYVNAEGQRSIDEVAKLYSGG
jgi:site-specific recombinase XerD